MNLWIVSQDETEFALVNRVYAEGNFIYGRSYDSKPILLGEYYSNDRCKEILSEIVSHVCMSEDSFCKSYKEADLQIKALMASYMIRIFQMPNS